MEVWAANHFDARSLRKQTAIPAAIERVGAKAPFLIQQPFARFYVSLDAVDDPE
jgi:hypothetical protein